MDVDLEELAEEDLSELGFAFNIMAFAVDDRAQVNHLLEHLNVCLHAAEFCQRSRLGSATKEIDRIALESIQRASDSLSVVLWLEALHGTPRPGVMRPAERILELVGLVLGDGLVELCHFRR